MGARPEIIIESNEPRITLERFFDAPRRRVFEAWTRAEQVKRWYSPSGFVVCDCDIDFRVNGRWRLVLRGPRGQEHRVSGEYREIETPERLVQTFRYDGAPQAEAVETLVFSEKDGKTLLTSTVVHTSAENLDWHVGSGLQEGAAQVLDRLSDHLESGVEQPTRDVPSVGGRKSTWAKRAGAATFALLGLAGGGIYWWSRQGVADRYVTETVGRGSVIRTVSVNGSVSPVGAAPIRAEARGEIEAVFCEIGSKVKAGQSCAKIDQRPYRVLVDREKAALADALARLKKDEAGLARAKEDLDRATKRRSARSALDKARAAYEQASERAALGEAAVARSRESLRSAEADLARADIVSPIDGTVASRNAEPGQTVGTGEGEAALFVVAPDLAAMQVEANANSKDAGEIELGDKATFVVDRLPGRVYDGEVSQIRRSPSAGEAAAGHDVVIAAPNPDLSLAAGMRATVQVVVDRRDDVVRAPDRSLRYSAGKPGGDADTPRAGARLWLLRHGRPTAIAVRLGLDDGAFTEVAEGDLLPGDRLIVGERDRRSGDAAPAAAE